MAILGVTLFASIFVSRPFCRYLCPMGGFLAVLGKFSFATVNRDSDKCINCKKCDSVCPVNINVSQLETINKNECISCGECMVACKKKNAVQFSIQSGFNLTSWVRPNVIAVLVVTLFFGGITITKATGFYQSKPPSIEQFKASGDFTPEMIKGYMTLEEVSYLFDLSIESIYSQLDLTLTQIPPSTKCKEIAEMIGRHFDTDQVRLGVAALLDIPADQVQTSCAPSGQTGLVQDGQPGFIYGTMTLKEVADAYNIPLDVLYDQLGIDIDNIPPVTQCRELKNLVSPDFHTSRVREVASCLYSKN
jgi:ferredoxin